MRRMTPAKLLLLMDKQKDKLALQELPIAMFQALFYNANKHPGDVSQGIAPAPAKSASDFRVFGRKGKSLAAKDGYNPRASLDGAKADRGAWSAWASKHTQPVVRKRS